MADNEPTPLPPVSPEHRRAAVGQFERANQVIASGNHDYGIQLLLSCCKLDPGNMTYRQALRRTEKTKFKNNMRGSAFSLLTTSPARARIKSAKRARNYLLVLEHGEDILTKNPWDTGAQLDMAEAAEALGLVELAIWLLEQARQKDPLLPALNRTLARLFEKRGNFTQAIALWEMVRKADPQDIEANHKARDLAASETISRGQYDQAVGAPAEKSGEEKPAATARSPVIKQASEVVTLQGKIEADPTRTGGYLNLAAFFRRANQLDRARQVLQKGLGPTGNDFQIALELADLEVEPFRRDLVKADERLQADPQNPELVQIRAKLQKEINRREIDLFRMKADRFTTELAHRLELGIRLLRAGLVDEAIKELQSAKADGRLAWRSLFFLGHCFRARNNWRLARRNWEDALQALPPGEQNARKEMLFSLAQGCADAGDLAAAIEKAHELANIDFGFRDIGRLLDEWQAKLQQA